MIEASGSLQPLLSAKMGVADLESPTSSTVAASMLAYGTAAAAGLPAPAALTLASLAALPTAEAGKHKKNYYAFWAPEYGSAVFDNWDRCSRFCIKTRGNFNRGYASYEEACKAAAEAAGFHGWCPAITVNADPRHLHATAQAPSFTAAAVHAAVGALPPHPLQHLGDAAATSLELPPTASPTPTHPTPMSLSAAAGSSAFHSALPPPVPDAPNPAPAHPLQQLGDAAAASLGLTPAPEPFLHVYLAALAAQKGGTTI